MRKFSIKYRKFLIRKAKWEMRRRNRITLSKRQPSVRRSLNPKELKEIAPSGNPGLWPVRVGKNQEVEISLPGDLSFSRNFEHTVRFLARLRDMGKSRRTKCRIRFETARQVGPAATLALASEIDRWRIHQGIRFRVLDYESWDPNVARLFNEKGLFQLVEARRAPRKTDYSRVTGQRFVKFVRGISVEGELARELRLALQEVSHVLINHSRLYAGLVEAMTNVVHHAYRTDLGDSTPENVRCWWMSGSYDNETHLLSIFFYDHGLGIPATLPRKYTTEKIQGILEMLGLPDDEGGRIEAAMEIGRTRTDSPGRGRGLSQIRDVISLHGNGRLRILSGKGEYLYDANGHTTRRTHAIGISGTLVHWDLVLKSELDGKIK